MINSKAYSETKGKKPLSFLLIGCKGNNYSLKMQLFSMFYLSFWIL